MPELKFRLMSLGAKAVGWKHKGGNILSEIRLQPIAGHGDMPDSIPASPPLIMYVDPKALKIMDRGAELDVTITPHKAPIAKPTASEDALAKKAWKEILGIRKSKDKVETNLKKINARLTDYQGKISAKGGEVKNLSGPEQEEYNALTGQREYLTNEAAKCEGRCKELEDALPLNWKSPKEKAAAADAKEKAEAKAEADTKASAKAVAKEKWKAKAKAKALAKKKAKNKKKS